MKYSEVILQLPSLSQFQIDDLKEQLADNIHPYYRNHEVIMPSDVHNFDVEILDHEYVDLGLPSGTLWASENLEPNKFFSWGDVDGHTIQEVSNGYYFDWRSYKYCKGEENKLIKYCNNRKYGLDGFTDDLTELTADDDAATTAWGSGWCIPTKSQFDELCDPTHVTITSDGNELRIVSNYNGNRLIFPTNGYINGKYHIATDAAYLWSKNVSSNKCISAFLLVGQSESSYVTEIERCCGLKIRPVRVRA